MYFTGPKFTFLILTMAEFICLKKEITWDFGLLPCILTYPDMYFVYLQLHSYLLLDRNWADTDVHVAWRLTGVTNDIKRGSVLFKCPNKPRQCDSEPEFTKPGA